MSGIKAGGTSPQAVLPKPERPSLETKFREVSQMYEKQFMREMVKAMRSTVPESGFIKTNQAERIFRDQLDDEYVNGWSQKGGVGFADIIYDQLMDKFGSMTGRPRMLKPMGPIQMNEKTNTDIKFQLSRSADPNKIDMTLRREKSAWPDQNVVAPWSGTLMKSLPLGEEKHLVEIDHGQGLLGRYIFKGWSEDLGPKASIEAGQVIGKMSPDSEALYWSLRNQTPESGPGPQKTTGE